MTKPKKFPYQIQYTDNTYRMVDWTKAEYASVGESMSDDKRIVVLDDGIYVLSDIRTIVIIPEIEPVVEEESQLSEYGGYDIETIEWLKSQGIDITNGGGTE
jgi:hypothetical protein